MKEVSKNKCRRMSMTMRVPDTAFVRLSNEQFVANIVSMLNGQDVRNIANEEG